MKQVGSGIILLPGNEESPMNYTDNTYPFHQDSSFLYFFGLDFPSLAAVIDIEQGQESVTVTARGMNMVRPDQVDQIEIQPL